MERTIVVGLYFRLAAARRVGSYVALAALACVSGCALADDPRGSMLALGDSVVFGFVDNSGDGYRRPENFPAYPQIVGEALGLSAINASCPGETTSSFLSSTGQDNGCRQFRADFPLHVTFSGAQMDFARDYVSVHRNVQLVTLSLGGNDGFLLQAACKHEPSCVKARLPAVLALLRSNLNLIFRSLRASGYKGALVLVNYYSLDYRDTIQTGFTIELNRALAEVAAANGAILADAFAAFRLEAAKRHAGGDTCKTGLLNEEEGTSSGCDVHPSLAGQRLLAQTVLAAYRGAK
jgi:lysophospholipase L1-like esterase